MWFIGKTGDQAVVQTEIDGMKDVDKIRAIKTASARCQAFLDAAAATRSPSLVLVMPSPARIASGAQSERRGDAGPVRDLLAVRPHRPLRYGQIVYDP